MSNEYVYDHSCIMMTVAESVIVSQEFLDKMEEKYGFVYERSHKESILPGGEGNHLFSFDTSESPESIVNEVLRLLNLNPDDLKTQELYCYQEDRFYLIEAYSTGGRLDV